jgi:hypothetical protein
MPYEVVTPSTPLWADHQRTFKKGKAMLGTKFKAAEVVTDGGLDMGKVDAIGYLKKPDDAPAVGDGWIELKNCAPVAAVPEPGGAPVPVVLKAGRYRVSGEVLVEEIAEPD